MRDEECEWDGEEDGPAIDEALAALNAGELREMIHSILPWLDVRARGQFVNRIIDRAAAAGSGWTPDEPSRSDVDSIVAFARAAKRDGYADPAEVDDYLRLGSNAFLGKNYQAARDIFASLLQPLGEIDIDLGQHESLEEMLCVDVVACSAQYLVATYMTNALGERPAALSAALGEISGVGCFYSEEPLSRMEQAAVEPLPDFDDFLRRWQSLLEERLASAGDDDDHGDPEWAMEWLNEEDGWLREVVQRVEGVEGLARIARSTRRPADFRVWCRVISATGDWKAALSAFEEAADLVTSRGSARAEFLDDAALATQQLGRRDLPARLERAWREAPSMIRLIRWVGSATSKTTVRKRAAEALEDCPEKAYRQQAFLGAILGRYESVARLLAQAPGLGWSHDEHPGRLVFPLFQRILEDEGASRPGGGRSFPHYSADTLYFGSPGTWKSQPSLATPEVGDVLDTAGLKRRTSRRTRDIMLDALRGAAMKRMAGITENKRRRYYGDVAELVAVCAALDMTPETARWVADIRAQYSRYSALQREFDRCLGPR